MATATPPTAAEELRSLIGVLPERLVDLVRSIDPEELLEIVMDLGRVPEARLATQTVVLADGPVTASDIEHVLARVSPVGNDNRAGIERTLHRVSAIRNRQGRVVGLTLRMGRAIFGTIDMLKDLVESGKNLLLLGRPGVGKTTKLREVARVLADDLGKRVMVVDTSNEIGGDGDIPHPAIGGARRMQVARTELQHAVMIEAVENHMPEAIIVDEIGTEAEAAAARTIAERGVQLIATAHGNTLENLILNPTLSDVVGGVHTVTLSDEEARRRGTLKTVTERRAPPTFDMVVEMVGRDEVVIHRETAASVDALLAGKPLSGERRVRSDGGVEVSRAEPTPRTEAPPATPAPRQEGPMRIHAYGVGRDLLERAVKDLNLDVRIVSRPDAADVVLVVRSRAGEPRIRRLAERGDVLVHVLKRASAAELRRTLRNAFATASRFDEELREALAEMEHAIERSMNENFAVPLAPRTARVRKMQQRIAARYHLLADSEGSGPERHLVVYPPGFSPPAPSAPEDAQE